MMQDHRSKQKYGIRVIASLTLAFACACGKDPGDQIKEIKSQWENKGGSIAALNDLLEPDFDAAEKRSWYPRYQSDIDELKEWYTKRRRWIARETEFEVNLCVPINKTLSAQDECALYVDEKGKEAMRKHIARTNNMISTLQQK